MKIALGIITRNEREILHKTLLHSLAFQYKFAVDFFSNDLTVELLGKSFGFLVHSQKWEGSFAHARNILIQCAEEAGMDAIVMLDADETMDLKGIAHIHAMLENHDVVSLPRYEFVKDFNHYDPTLYPDYQTRAFHLHKGFYFTGKLHERLIAPPAITALSPIYHYGKLKNISVVALKYINYDRVTKGLEPLEQLPVGFNLDTVKLWKRCVPFDKPHPLQSQKI